MSEIGTRALKITRVVFLSWPTKYDRQTGGQSDIGHRSDPSVSSLERIDMGMKHKLYFAFSLSSTELNVNISQTDEQTDRWISCLELCCFELWQK